MSQAQRMQKVDDVLTLPNIITLFRLLLIFPVLNFYHQNLYQSSLIAFIILLFTDFLDGTTARKFNQCSTFGSLFDPIVDKIVIMTFFTVFYFDGVIPLFIYALIIIRNIAQLSSIPILRFWMKIHFKVVPSSIAKWATTLSFLTIFFCLSKWPLSNSFGQFTSFLLFPLIALIESFMLITYIPRFFAIAKGKHNTFN